MTTKYQSRRMRDGREVFERAYDLYATSVQDMQSSISHYGNFEDIKVLELVRLISMRHGEKTRVIVVTRHIKKILREAGFKFRREIL